MRLCITYTRCSYQNGLKKFDFQVYAVDPHTMMNVAQHKLDPATGLIQAVVKMAALDSVGFLFNCL